MEGPFSKLLSTVISDGFTRIPNEQPIPLVRLIWSDNLSGPLEGTAAAGDDWNNQRESERACESISGGGFL